MNAPRRAARRGAPARLVQCLRSARERRHRGRLRHPADPRRRAAAPAEVVLPGEEVAARGGELEQPVDGAAQLVHRAGGTAARSRAVRQALARQPVDLAPAREGLELQPAAGVVLEHRRVAAERRPLGGGRERRVRPELRVAVQDQERRPQPAGGEQVLRGEVVDRRQDRVQLGGARAGQMVERAPRVVVVAREARVGDGRDVPGEEGVAQGAGDRSRVVGAADRGAQECEAARLGRGGRTPARGLQLTLVLGRADLGRRSGLRRGRLGLRAASGQADEQHGECEQASVHATASTSRSGRLTALSVTRPRRPGKDCSFCQVTWRPPDSLRAQMAVPRLRVPHFPAGRCDRPPASPPTRSSSTTARTRRCCAPRARRCCGCSSRRTRR